MAVVAPGTTLKQLLDAGVPLVLLRHTDTRGRVRPYVPAAHAAMNAPVYLLDDGSGCIDRLGEQQVGGAPAVCWAMAAARGRCLRLQHATQRQRRIAAACRSAGACRAQRGPPLPGDNCWGSQATHWR